MYVAKQETPQDTGDMRDNQTLDSHSTSIHTPGAATIAYPIALRARESCSHRQVPGWEEGNARQGTQLLSMPDCVFPIPLSA